MRTKPLLTRRTLLGAPLALIPSAGAAAAPRPSPRRAAADTTAWLETPRNLHPRLLEPVLADDARFVRGEAGTTLVVRNYGLAVSGTPTRSEKWGLSTRRQVKGWYKDATGAWQLRLVDGPVKNKGATARFVVDGGGGDLLLLHPADVGPIVDTVKIRNFRRCRVVGLRCRVHPSVSGTHEMNPTVMLDFDQAPDAEDLFIEGLDIDLRRDRDGNPAVDNHADGIRLAALAGNKPNAGRVVIQNSRVVGIGNTSREGNRLLDDGQGNPLRRNRDNSGGGPHYVIDRRHPDCIQAQNGLLMKYFYMQRCHFSSSYQGIYMPRNQANGAAGGRQPDWPWEIVLREVVVEMQDPPYNTCLVLRDGMAGSGNHVSNLTVHDVHFHAPDGRAWQHMIPQTNFHASATVNTLVLEAGDVAGSAGGDGWWTGTIQRGLPPSGTFVPARAVGSHYVSYHGRLPA